MAEGLFEERFKEAGVLPLWLYVGPATAPEPRATEKPCMWSWRELKSCCQSRPVTAAAFNIANDNFGVVAKAWDDVKLTPTTYLVNKRSGIVN